MNARDLPAPPHAFTLTLQVRPEHIDGLGHAGNVVWLQWVNDAAIAHSRSLGLGTPALRERGVLWVVRKHEIEYLTSALEGEVLRATTWVETLRGATSLRRTLIHRAADDALLARALTTWVLIDAVAGKPRRIPSELMARYGLPDAGTPAANDPPVE